MFSDCLFNLTIQFTVIYDQKKWNQRFFWAFLLEKWLKQLMINKLLNWLIFSAVKKSKMRWRQHPDIISVLPVGVAVSPYCVFHHRCSKFYHSGLISSYQPPSGVLTETQWSTCSQEETPSLRTAPGHMTQFLLILKTPENIRHLSCAIKTHTRVKTDTHIFQPPPHLNFKVNSCLGNHPPLRNTFEKECMS